MQNATKFRLRFRILNAKPVTAVTRLSCQDATSELSIRGCQSDVNEPKTFSNVAPISQIRCTTFGIISEFFSF